MITLNEREKILVKVLAAVVAVASVYYLIIVPVMKFRSSTADGSRSGREKIDKLAQISQEYKQVKDRKYGYEKTLRQTRGVTSLVEEYAKNAGILDNKVYTRDTPGTRQDQYKKITTDVKFEGVSIVPVLEFIYNMENSGVLVKISYLRINQAFKGRDTYDVTLKFDSVSKE